MVEEGSGVTVDPVRCISSAPQGKASSEAWRRKLGYSVVGALKVCQEVIDQRGNFSWFGQEERRRGGEELVKVQGEELVKVQGQKG